MSQESNDELSRLGLGGGTMGYGNGGGVSFLDIPKIQRVQLQGSLCSVW